MEVEAMEPLPGESDSPSVTAENPLEIRSDLAEGGESTFASIFSTIRPTERDQLGYNQDKALEENTFQGCNKMESFAAEGSLLSGAKQLVERFEYEESLQIRKSTSKESISHSSSVEDFVDEVLNEARSCKADSNRPASVSDLEVIGAEAGLDSILDSGCNEHIISTIEDRELKKSANKISKYSLSDTSKDFFAGNTARARVMPKRQGTLTENNPFRCTTRIENSEAPERSPINEEELAIEDEKTTLATVALFSRSVTDEDEEVVVGEEEGEEQTDAFNPFQTIYPASEKESSEEEEEEGDEVEDEESTKLGFPQVEIKPEKPVENGTEKTKCMVPLLPAPPKPTTPAYQQDEKESNLHEFELPASGDKTLKDFVLKNKTPSGWETFFETATSPQTQATVDIAESELVKAFEVDWSEPPPVDSKTAPVPVVPEPPRPETPDPALEEPFAPSFPLNHVWRLWLRFPEKKKKVKQLSKYTSDRTWKEVAVTLTEDRGRYEINLHEIDSETGTHNAQPFRTLRTEPYMQLSRCKLQQYDKYGKLNIFKVNHVTYRELPGMRPEKFSLKTLQQLVSHKPKQNVALDHLPIYSEILKFGSLDQTMMRGLMSTLEDALMRIPSHKDEGLSYSHEEICCYVIDEYVGEVSESGTIREQKARTRIFCSAFVNKGPHIVLGINDKWRFGREIVRRSDILPVMHDEWITIWKPEFHSCLEMEDYEKDHMLKFYPLDGCKFELMRFRVSLRNNRELPLQLHCAYSIDDRRVSMRCELLVPGYFTASQRSGAVPCEDVEIRIPVPEEWIYHFRVEKHNRYGSVHSTLRKPGKIKGLERITQMAQSLLPPSLLEASIGLAKYEHIYKSVVWRIPRVPEKNEASYRPHLLTCNLLLAPHDVVPEWDTLTKTVHIEYCMPSSTVSGTTVRSISVETTGNAEKFVRYTAKYRYTVDINYQLGHRKDKPLRGLFDETAEGDEMVSSSSDSEPEVDEESDSAQAVAPSGEAEIAEGDLLGLGISSISPLGAAPEEKGKQEIHPSPASNVNDLADIFG
uniref:Protein stoned-B n=1 Tax=Schistocephalus solidus TaxID=70667 RepID=A0A0X3NIJ4_SCHSO